MIRQRAFRARADVAVTPPTRERRFLIPVILAVLVVALLLVAFWLVYF